MQQKFGILIAMGLLVGGLYGIFLGAAIENTIIGVAMGALGGVFLGWFAAAARFKN